MCPSPCPLCGAVDSYALPVAGKHYHRCRSCELVWLDVICERICYKNGDRFTLFPSTTLACVILVGSVMDADGSRRSVAYVTTLDNVHGFIFANTSWCTILSP